jgi:hypothetical protein
LDHARPLRIASLLALACVSPQPGAVERCPSLRQLPPRPSERCEADAEVIAYQDTLAALLTSASGPLALRVVLDERSRVASVCAEGTVKGMENARARRSLADNLGDVWALPPGPGCLAGTRIDVDRRQAKLVQIGRIEAQCRGEMRATGGDPGRSNASIARNEPSPDDREIAPDACIESRLSWLFAEQRGSWWRLSARARGRSSGALLFAPMEGVQPPPAQARLVARTCAKLGERDALVACMQELRWELLD